ncbi:WHG domain-containing protein [Sphaerisporangium rubeum]|uniref:AcrR family transcriptional regulator n=1 Tax=Sphaerisporangium rubeum TaxID=321317 RepID=A0A7X0M8I8_9ACTN|nr:AcrR family transcriptional regulator [Sphaerisporangium rubeum]
MAARDVSTPKETPAAVADLRRRLVEASQRVLREHGPAELTVRRVAEAAGSSTMGIYTHFGGRGGMLEAVYLDGFEQLRAALTHAAGDHRDDGTTPADLTPAEPTTASDPARRASAADPVRRPSASGPVRRTSATDPARRITALALAYRGFALRNPPLYALMFERPIPDFDPPPELRLRAIGMTFPFLVTEIENAVTHGTLRTPDPRRTGYLLWTAIHGMVSIELTHTTRGSLPGWLLGAPEAGEHLFTDGLSLLLSGLR